MTSIVFEFDRAGWQTAKDMPPHEAPSAHMIALIDEVHRLRGRILSALSGVREACGLNQTESTVLSAAVNALHPPTVPEIGRSLGHPRQVIQRSADSLVERELLGWVVNPDHKRARRLVATPAGRAVHADADRRARIWADQLVASIAPDRLSDTVATLRELRGLLQSPPS